MHLVSYLLEFLPIHKGIEKKNRKLYTKNFQDITYEKTRLKYNPKNIHLITI